MFDMSWGEIMVIGGVALIVIGPKDLPKALRTVGQMTTKVRRMAGEFQSQFSEAMREAELEDVRKEVEGLNREVSTATAAAFNPIQTIRDEFKGSGEPQPGAATGLAAAPDAPAASAFDEPAMPDPIVPALPPVAEPAAGAAFPETQPLVPLPVDEPALPSAPPSAAPHPEPERVGDAARDQRT